MIPIQRNHEREDETEYVEYVDLRI
jgi:hypothetical protein